MIFCLMVFPIQICFRLLSCDVFNEPDPLSSIFDLLLFFCLSFDHLVRSRQHVRWDRQADLLGGFKMGTVLATALLAGTY